MRVPISVRSARAYLSVVAEPPAPALCAFVGAVGPERAAALVRRGEVPAPVAAETSARRSVDRAEHDLRAAEAVGARLLVPEDPDWPAAAIHAFELCAHPHLAAPLALWVRGPARLGELTGRSVAIVGARAATAYGRGVANSLGYGVAERGGTVFSGAAFGIDAAAHRGALAAGGVTVAVLACGLDRPYPAAHHRLIEHIAERGLVVSEYPPGAVPARHRFLVRNRIIAGLGGGTVVVEARGRSGARRTASDAVLLGRPLMAVPGPVTSALSVGCHRLLREPGTIAVTSAEEVLEEVGRIGGDLAPLNAPDDLPRPTDRLSQIERRVHDALRDGRGGELGRLGVECGLPPEMVRAALIGLRRVGLADRAAEGWRPCDGGERRGDT